MRTGSDESALTAELNDLLQLDHDAVEAYTIAIDAVSDPRYREQLVEYRADHKRHIEELAALVRARGALPIELPHATGPLKLAVQAIGAAGGDVTLLLAFKAVEGQARDKYQRFAAKPYPPDVAEVVRRGAEDERTHYRWVEQSLRELGAGDGTLQHGLASIVEGVHKIIADPVEAVAREVMRQVGETFGAARGRSARAAESPASPSPADIANAEPPLTGGPALGQDDLAMEAALMTAEPPSAGTDAIDFIDALRTLEESGDVERIVALFDDDAEISNTTRAQPHRGREGAREFWQTYRGSFERIHSDFSKVVQDDDTAMLEWTSTGHVKGGGEVTYSGVSVLELRDGKVRRFRAYFDNAELDAHLRPSD